MSNVNLLHITPGKISSKHILKNVKLIIGDKAAIN